MKKKIFLTALMVITLICIFSLSVSAAETNEFGTVERIDGIDLTDMNTDGDARVVLVESDGVTYHTYPANYIVTNNAKLTFDFSRITTATYTKDSIVRFELPKGVTTISGSGCIGSKTGLVEVILGNDLTTIEKEIFSNYSALSKVTFGNKLTEIGRHTFNGTAITELVIPNSVTSLGDGYNFQGCKSLVNVTLSESLTTIPKYAFSNCHCLVTTIPDNVTTIEEYAFNTACYSSGNITINKTSQLKSIGASAFRDTKKLQSIYLPSTLETIGDYAFAYTGCTSFENLENTQVTKLENCTFYDIPTYEELKLPKNLTEIGSSAVNIKGTVYVPKTVTTVAASSFYTHWKSGTIIFTGESADLLKTCTKLADATAIDASEYDETASYEGFKIIYNYSHCKLYYDNVHVDKEPTYDFIGQKYISDLYKYAGCERCSVVTKEKAAGSVFTSRGYSKDETEGSIMYDIVVNYDNLTFFTEKTGASLNFGLAVSGNSNLTTLINDDESIASTDVLKIKFSGTQYKNLQTKITNIGENTSVKIHACAYVIEDTDGVKTVSYIGNGVTATSSTAISYDDIS